MCVLHGMLNWNDGCFAGNASITFLGLLNWRERIECTRMWRGRWGSMDQPTTLSVFTAPFPSLKFLFPNKKGILWFLNLRISHLVFKIPEFYVTPRDMARLSDSMLKKASAGPALNRSLAYIVKPVSASRGRGIFFANKVIQFCSIDRSILRDRHRHVLSRHQ